MLILRPIQRNRREDSYLGFWQIPQILCPFAIPFPSSVLPYFTADPTRLRDQNAPGEVDEISTGRLRRRLLVVKKGKPPKQRLHPVMVFFRGNEENVIEAGET